MELLAIRELNHISNMIGMLERQVYQDHHSPSEKGVLHPDYWRSRVNDVLTMPDVPKNIQRQGVALLERVERLSLVAAGKSATGAKSADTAAR